MFSILNYLTRVLIVKYIVYLVFGYLVFVLGEGGGDNLYVIWFMQGYVFGRYGLLKVDKWLLVYFKVLFLVNLIINKVWV